MVIFFFFFWLHWVFAATQGLSLVAVHRRPITVDSSCCRARALGCVGSVVVVPEF